jgi:membrane protein DedA with SNARE-associated domain
VGDAVSDLARWITEVVYFFGCPGVAVLAALSNLVLLIPSQLVLPLAGYQASQGCFSFLLVLVAATAGSLAGALILYSLGRWLGEENLRRFVWRFGRYVVVDKSDLDKASEAFDRHGGRAVLICLLLPGVGNLNSLPAGIERMPGWRLVAYTVLESSLRNGALIGFGWVLGDRWVVVEQYAQVIKYAALAAIAAGISWFLWGRWKARRE